MACWSAYGSSPHTWGIRVDFFGVAGNARFIPTYVGHTHSSDVYRPFRSVHPHIRGAYSCCPPVVWVFPGSSPHTWGILKRLQQFREHRRFIPTYVGHTWACLLPSGRQPVHPHIRGAYSAFVTSFGFQHGSSPHTWGIHSFQVVSGAETRFIPTYVGHTCVPPLPTPSIPVHPHIRGAYHKQSQSLFFPIGSSPHTWGIRTRISTTATGGAVHPHIRGAYPTGASPGTEVKRFIPTYVGHTFNFSFSSSFAAVHPHIRGAYAIALSKASMSCGSSPHTWGIPLANFLPTGGDAVHPHIRGAYKLRRYR